MVDIVQRPARRQIADKMIAPVKCARGLGLVDRSVCITEAVGYVAPLGSW